MKYVTTDLDSFSRSELFAANQERRSRLDQIRADAGGSLADLSDFTLREEARELHSELKSIEDRLGHGGYRPGPVREDRSARADGWAPGHWSGPFMRKQFGDAIDGSPGTAALTPSGAITVPGLTEGLVPIEDRPRRLLEVIPKGETLEGTDQFAYLRETTRVHNAAETARGALKPTSNYDLEKVEDRCRVVAHISQPIDRYALEDTRLLAQYLDGALRDGVLLRVDRQILLGSGIGENLTGLANTSGIQVQAFAIDLLTTARKALTLLQDEEIVNGVYVLSPAMWESLELLTVGDDEHYALNPGGAKLPVDRAQQRLWGQPVIVTSALTGTDAYLADFAGSTRLYEAGGVRIDWSEAPEGSVDGEAAFKSNEVIFRGEGRFGLAVTRPSGVVEFDTTV